MISFLDYTSLFQKQPPNKKMFLEILHNSKENTCARVLFLTRLQDVQMTASVTCEVFLCICKLNNQNPIPCNIEFKQSKKGKQKNM